MTKIILLLFPAVLSVFPLRAQPPLAPNSWGTGMPMPTSRQSPFTGAINQKIYVIGGISGSNYYSVNEVYDTTTNTWTTASPMPASRGDGASAVVNNILYAIGGETSSSTETNVVEAYDPTTDTWTAKSPMPTSLNSIYAVVENGIIYVIGGYNGGRVNTLLAYNPATDTWSTLASLKVGKSQPAVGLLGSTIIAAGGLSTDNTNATTDNEGYYAATNSWTTLAPLPTARQAGCFETAGGLLYFAGGHSVAGGSLLSTMDAYNAATNSWMSGLPHIPTAVANPGSASVGGMLYCFGGSNTGQNGAGVTIYNLVQIYQPPPAINLGGVVPVFSSANTIEPGSWISIYGTNLATGTTVWNGNFPTMLGGTSVTINNRPAYIWYVSPTQINVQAPDDNTLGPVPVAVTIDGVTSSATVTLGQYGPSFSLFNGMYPAAIVPTSGPGNSGAGYDYIGPSGAFSFPSRPVKAGETVILYGVGFGPTTPPVPAGQLFSGAAPSVTLPVITIGGVQAQVSFGGIIEAGLFQFNVVVPSAGGGDQILQAMIGGVTTPANVFITLQ